MRGLSILVLIATGVLAGCGTSDDRDDASAAAVRLLTAVERGDGSAACRELTEEAEDALAKSRAAPCEEAILQLELAASRVGRVTVAMTAAQADLLEGGTLFLDRTSQGWKISAAGCEPRPGQPYECELDG